MLLLIVVLCSGAAPPKTTKDEAPPATDKTPPAGKDKAETPPAGKEKAPPAVEEEEPPPDPAVEVPRLLRSAAEGATSEAIVAKLKALEPKKAVPQFVPQTLSHYDERVRLATIHAIVAFKLKSTRQQLAMAFGDSSPDVVAASARALHALGGKGADDEVRSLLKHRSVKVRCAAADLVRRQRHKKRKVTALEAQYKRAKLPEERACILAALHKGGVRKIMKRVVPLVANPNTRDLGVAVMSLDPEQSRDALLTALTPKASEEMIAGALTVASGHGPDGMDWIAARLANKRETVRRAALDVLLSKAADAHVRELLIEAAVKSDVQTRARVIDALKKRGDKALLPMARKWLRDKSPVIRAAAARVLAAMPDSKDNDLVLRTYQDERMIVSDANLDTRVALLEAMGVYADPARVPVLVEAMGQKGEAQAATDALVAIGEPAVRTLLLVVKVGDMERIPFALEALARIGTGVGDAAEGLFRHPRELVRELGRDLMAASGDPRAVPALVELFRSETLEDPVPLIQSIATFNTPEARAALVEASDHPNDSVRVAAVAGLAQSHRRSKDVVSAIRQVAETDKVPVVRAAAVHALFQLGPDGLQTLLSKLVQFEVPEVRIACYEALGWLGHPGAATKMSPRLRDATGKEKEALDSALRRLTRRTDMKSDRNYRDWWEDFEPRLKEPKLTAGKVPSDGVELHYGAHGSGRTTIVLGGGQSSRMFAPALARVSGTRFVYLDGRGRGETRWGKGVTLRSEIGDIERTRRALKAGRVNVLAFGAAGLVAMSYTRTYPKHVARLVLVSTPPRGIRHGAENTAARRMKGAAAIDLAKLDARHAWFAPVAWLSYRHTALAPGLAADPRHGPLIAAYPIHPVAGQALEKLAQKLDARTLAPTLKTPIYFVVGTRSALTGGQQAALERMARDNKHVQVRTLKKTGHYPHLERPNAFAALVQSLLVRSK